MCLPAGSPALSGSSTERRAVTRAATDGQHWLNRTGLSVGFAQNTLLLLSDGFLLVSSSFNSQKKKQ